MTKWAAKRIERARERKRRDCCGLMAFDVCAPSGRWARKKKTCWLTWINVSEQKILKFRLPEFLFHSFVIFQLDSLCNFPFSSSFNFFFHFAPIHSSEKFFFFSYFFLIHFHSIFWHSKLCTATLSSASTFRWPTLEHFSKLLHTRSGLFRICDRDENFFFSGLLEKNFFSSLAHCLDVLTEGVWVSTCEGNGNVWASINRGIWAT